MRTNALAAPPMNRRIRNGPMVAANPMPPVVIALAASEPSSQTRREPGRLGIAASNAPKEIAEEIGGSDKPRCRPREAKRLDHRRQDRRVNEAADADRCGQRDQPADRGGRGRLTGMFLLDRATVVRHAPGCGTYVQFLKAI